MRLTATCPAGLEPALESEWRALGAGEITQAPGSVSVPFETELLYRAHEHLRAASRLLIELAQGPANNAETLYEFLHNVEWEKHFRPDKSLAVLATGSNRELRHTRFVAQQTKDAIVDRLRSKTGNRPNVELQKPDLRAFVHIHADRAWTGLDVSAEGLHRRGYRQSNATAPVRENLAAGLLILCGWPARGGGEFLLFDPMCGSGTLALEALFIAAGVAPGALRRKAGHASGFEAWPGYEKSKHEAILRDAKSACNHELRIVARDISRESVSSVRAAYEKLCTQHDLGGIPFEVEHADFFEAPAPHVTRQALLVTNPPYGERLGGHVDEAKPLYRRMGDRLKEAYAGWDAWLLCGNKQLAKSVGLRADASHRVMHGGIDARFAHFPIRARIQTATPKPKERNAEAQMFENRLRKCWKKQSTLRRRQKTTAFRIYDRDIPEFNFSVDWYDGHVRVEERERPHNVAESDADRRRRAALDVVCSVLNVGQDDVSFRVRSRDQGQQDPVIDADETFTVEEHGLLFEVNLKRYLDTGLFLDGALVRKWLRAEANEKRFLNLFSYTCTASIAAAKGGALSCTNVDLSKTALAWGKRNASINACKKQLRFIHHDVVPWLHECREKYDLVYAGVPTYSTSRQAREPFDAVRGQHKWLQPMMKCVENTGCLVLSTHARDFRPSETDRYLWEDCSEDFVAEGFRKSPRSQRVFQVRHRA